MIRCYYCGYLSISEDKRQNCPRCNTSKWMTKVEDKEIRLKAFERDWGF